MLRVKAIPESHDSERVADFQFGIAQSDCEAVRLYVGMHYASHRDMAGLNRACW